MRRALLRRDAKRFGPATGCQGPGHAGLRRTVKGWRSGRAPVALGAAALVALLGVVDLPPASAAASTKGATTLHSCTWSALQAAIAEGGTVVFACSGTISPSTAITVSGSLTLDAAGKDVVLVGHELRNTGGTNTVRLFVVDDGSLTLDHLTLEDSQVRPAAGQNGTAGIAGTSGEIDSGDSGTSGSPGTSGAAGAVGQGGAMYVAAGAQVRILFSTFEDNGVEGSPGGKGGNGGNGGNGAANETNDAAGGDGSIGGSGGNGGNGGTGANGQLGEGGAIYNAGKLVLVDDNFTLNDALGSTGGEGGNSGSAGNAGSGGGGAWPPGCGTPTVPCPTENGASGGEPGGQSPAQAGDAGNSGNGEGGAVYNVGTLVVAGGTFSENGAAGSLGGQGGTGGAGGVGGNGGNGTCYFTPATGCTSPYGTAGIGTSGTDGSNGRAGGNGGAGLGGAIYNGGSLQLSGVAFSENGASGGKGGQGGAGGLGAGGGYGADCGATTGCNADGGNGGSGGSGGDGGNAGLAAGGAIYSVSTFAAAKVTYSDNKLEQHVGGAAGVAGKGGPGEPVGGDAGAAGASASSGQAPAPKGPNEVGATRSGLSLTTTSLAGAVVGKSYSATLKAKGGTKPYAWALVSGSLPKGLTLSASKGTITGKPRAKGTSTLSITVTDHSGEVSVATLAVKVSPN